MMDPAVLARVLAGKSVGEARYEAALEHRNRFQGLWSEAFNDFDLLVLPSVPILAKPVQLVDESDLSPSLFTRFVGLAGLCAISVPIRPAPDGRPTSLQIVAPKGADERALLAASVFQSATDWHLRRPPEFIDADGA